MCCNGQPTRYPGHDDPERRDDHADQTFQFVANVVNEAVKQIASRDQEQYDRRVRQENEEYDLRRRNIEHQSSLERQQLTEELGRRAANFDSNRTGRAAIDEENVENVTDAPDIERENPAS